MHPVSNADHSLNHKGVDVSATMAQPDVGCSRVAEISAAAYTVVAKMSTPLLIQRGISIGYGIHSSI